MSRELGVLAQMEHENDCCAPQTGYRIGFHRCGVLLVLLRYACFPAPQHLLTATKGSYQATDV